MCIRFAILVLLLGSIQVLRAQFTIRPISLHKGPGSTWLSYRFPLVHGTNKEAAQNVNRILQEKILENKDVITDSIKIFENSRYINNDTVNQPGYSEIDYNVLLNDSKILSFQFDMESTGAYSTMFPVYYSFDSKTGKQLSFTDLFKPVARQVLRRRLLAERKKLAFQYIKENYPDSEDSSYIRETYDECLEEDDIENIYIKPGFIVFYKEYCFPHVARPYDADLDVEISFKEINTLLTPYGKAIFNMR